MKQALFAACCALAAFPAYAQQQPNVLDTLNKALGGSQEQSRERDGDRRADVRNMEDRELVAYRDRLEREGRSIARELEDAEDEMRRRNISRR